MIVDLLNFAESVFSSFILDKPVESLIPREASPDETMRINILRMLTWQGGRILHHIHLLGEYSNPSIVPWRSKFLLFWGDAGGMNVRWINYKFEYETNQPNLGIDRRLSKLYRVEGNETIPVYSADIRVLPLSDSKFVFVGTAELIPPAYKHRMMLAEAVANETTNKIDIIKEY